MREDGKIDMPTFCPWCGNRWIEERVAPFCSTICLDASWNLHSDDIRQQNKIALNRTKKL